MKNAASSATVTPAAERGPVVGFTTYALMGLVNLVLIAVIALVVIPTRI